MKPNRVWKIIYKEYGTLYENIIGGWHEGSIFYVISEQIEQPPPWYVTKIITTYSVKPVPKRHCVQLQYIDTHYYGDFTKEIV